MQPELEKLLRKSSRLSNKNHKLTDFFNKCAMAKILDLFLNNPNTQINLKDMIEVTGISRKSIWINMPKLIESGVVTEEQEGLYKFYKLHIDNDQVKQISEFRDSISIKNVSSRRTY